jgi:hypothetical protein
MRLWRKVAACLLVLALPLDLYQATAALPALRHGANKRAKLAHGAAPPQQGTKPISNHQFSPHSHHKR